MEGNRIVRLLVALALFTLVACGVDGEPVQPTGGARVTLDNSGLGLGATVGVSGSPVALGLAL